MIPIGGVSNIILNSVIQPSRTWRIDFEKGRVVGYISELDAVKQSVFLILNSERYEYPIFSFDYGADLTNAIGKDQALIKSELNRRINDALTQDDRIERIENFTAEIQGDSIFVTFTVISKYGSFVTTQEVS